MARRQSISSSIEKVKKSVKQELKSSKEPAATTLFFTLSYSRGRDLEDHHSRPIQAKLVARQPPQQQQKMLGIDSSYEGVISRIMVPTGLGKNVHLKKQKGLGAWLQ
jgi:hypothetical protein